MPISVEKIIRLLTELADEKGLKVAVTESLKGGLITGSSTIVGGIVLGPVGLLAGSLIGGLSAYLSSKGKFESVASVIMKMDPSKKELLANSVREILQEIDYTDILQIITLLECSPRLKQRMVQEIINFFKSILKKDVFC